jgi:hypothetical protein
MALTTIRRYRDLSEAIVARSLLEASGISASLCDENLIRLNWYISSSIGGIRLQVEEDDETDAIEILDSPIPEVIDYDDGNSPYTQPRCPRCHSLNITFEGSDRKAALASLWAFAIPFPLGPETWTCEDCASQWQETEEPGQSEYPS